MGLRRFSKLDLRGVVDVPTLRVFRDVESQLRELTQANALVDAPGMIASDLADEPFIVASLTGNLNNERKLTSGAGIGVSDGGPGGNFVVSVAYAVPAITLGTANVEGISPNPIRADATIVAFNDSVAPADLAAAANAGNDAFAARRNHVHLHPNTIRSVGTVATLVLTASGTIATLTGSLATLEITGMTSFRPGATNTIANGAASRRWLSVHVGTNGINCTGPITSTSGLSSFDEVSIVNDLTINGVFSLVNGYAGHFYNATDATFDLGELSGPFRWRNVYLTGGAYLKDSGVDFFTILASNSNADLTANRTLTLDVANADRTLRLTGNPTLADWFDQNVKATADPNFNTIGVLDNATTFYLKLASNSLAPGGNFTADRTLTLDMQNADRALSIRGDSVISQNYSTAGTPEFAKLGVGGAAHATRKLAVYDGAAAPTAAGAAPVFTDYYGSGGTRALSEPTGWIWIYDGTSAVQGKIPYY